MIPVILDVDTGTDDALALLLATLCPQIDLLAVCVVHGNCPVERAVHNTLAVLEAAGADSLLPVARGFERPLVEPVHFCPAVHGQDGLGDLEPAVPAATSRSPAPEHAVATMLNALRCSTEPVTVVATGPLTNVAVAIRTEPDLWKQKCRLLVWMGGSVSAGGNSTAWGEANAFCDPEAAHIVLGSGLQMLM